MVTALAVGLMAVALLVAGVVTLMAGGRDTAPSAEPLESASESLAAGAEAAAEPAPAPAPEPEAEPEPEPEAETEPAPAPAPAPAPTPKPAGPQRFSVGLGQFGYEPSTLTAKAGVPIELTVAQGQGCAAGFLIPGLGISADNTQGPAKVKLPALEAGTYRFYCGMQMVEGKLVVR